MGQLFHMRVTERGLLGTAKSMRVASEYFVMEAPLPPPQKGLFIPDCSELLTLIRKLDWIRGSHIGDYEDYCFARCDAV
jgi:hypothetical protein